MDCGARKKKDIPPAEERVFRSNAGAEGKQSTAPRDHGRFPKNIICNQKYSIFTFIPGVMAQQLKHFLNVFFVMVMITQLYEPAQVSHPLTSIFPWCLVMTFVYIKEGYDDFNRYKRDKEANDALCTRFTANGPVKVPASELMVGDFFVVTKDERVPADSILLKTLESSGSLFVRTDQLDGETDWKIKMAVPVFSKHLEFGSVLREEIEAQAEEPNKDIYSFNGRISASGETQKVAEDNALWMNMVVAGGTGLCLVVYTGRDTKAVMNTTRPRAKSGLVDQELNFYTKILCTLAFGAAIMFTILRGTLAKWYITLVRFIIIFSTVIPISLRVNIDWARLVYAWMIEKDKSMRVKVRNSNIPEELGRISYLLTDKTGTLTKNEMEMKKMHTGNMCYTPDFIADIFQLITFPQSPADHGARRLLLAMCLCNNVIPYNENGELGYRASSPDEMAMVRWAQQVGLSLWGRGPEWVEIKDGENRIERYEVLHTIRFTSEKKRMGVVMRGRDGAFLYMKGADSVMKKLITGKDWIEEEAESMSREGLRTMVFGQRELTEQEVQDLKQGHHIAEDGLSSLGITGVEDKLQDGVRIALESLRNAGIKIWMLTGDKVETATCIALSSRLFTRYNSIVTVTGVKSRHDADAALQKIRRGGDCLVIDGESLRALMDVHGETFIRNACMLSAVACCRCTPTQKAEVAKAIHRITQKRVCCIGDGGNDVSMIQQANVGIGIVGKEGTQASLAADFSLTEFKSVTDLILWHGRNAYKNTAKLAQFIIHRGVILGVAQGVFSSLFGFCPISIYQGKISVGYVTFYTFLPVFSIVLSEDMTKKVARKFPELYMEISSGAVLNPKTFSSWMFMSYFQGTAIMVLTLYFFKPMLIMLVTITFSCLVLNELLMVFLCVSKAHYLMIFAQTFSIAMYILSFKVLSDELQIPADMPRFLLNVVIVNVVAILPAFLQWVWKCWMSPPSYRKIQTHY